MSLEEAISPEKRYWSLSPDDQTKVYDKWVAENFTDAVSNGQKYYHFA